MNERIKQLIWETDEWLESNAQSDRWEREIKFAELIVQECAQVCLAQRDPANLNYKPSVKFAEAITQHFGVNK